MKSLRRDGEGGLLDSKMFAPPKEREWSRLRLRVQSRRDGVASRIVAGSIARWLCLAPLLLCAITCGCRSENSRTIAVIPGTTATEFWEAAHGGAEAAGRDAGFRIYWNAPTREDDVERQIGLVERAIDSDYAGLVVAPTNYLALVGSVRQALSKHIPTVVIRSSLPI